jgi:hypothetical protein
MAKTVTMVLLLRPLLLVPLLASYRLLMMMMMIMMMMDITTTTMIQCPEQTRDENNYDEQEERLFSVYKLHGDKNEADDDEMITFMMIVVWRLRLLV